MTTDEIEKSAMQAAHMSSPDPPADLLDTTLYLALYQLYATFYAGQLTREQARPIKLKILMQYRKQKSSYDFDMKLRRASVTLWRDIECAASAYCREPTIPNADKLHEAIYHVKRKENITYG